MRLSGGRPLPSWPLQTVQDRESLNRAWGDEIYIYIRVGMMEIDQSSYASVLSIDRWTDTRRQFLLALDLFSLTSWFNTCGIKLHVGIAPQSQVIVPTTYALSNSDHGAHPS
jgi:hypothetical protein